MIDVSSWEVAFSCILIFTGLGTVASIMLRYRLKIRSAGSSAWEHFKWMRE